ncbi:MAG TPA: type II secretion system F family protein [Acidimicrobiia bacterium]|nr:type II secretion system F family protein [Acidimicrobiia bacterium]
MVVLAAVAAVLVVARPHLAIPTVAVLAAAVVGGPLAVVIACGTITAVWAARRARITTLSRRRAAGDELRILDLVALGMTGGLAFPQAAAFAASIVGGTVGAELARCVRSGRSGVQVSSEVPAIEAMTLVARRSDASGSPLGPEIRRTASLIRSERAASERERLARLPVKLLFPLAFAILPGFILMTVGPAVISGIARLGA